MASKAQKKRKAAARRRTAHASVRDTRTRSEVNSVAVQEMPADGIPASSKMSRSPAPNASTASQPVSAKAKTYPAWQRSARSLLEVLSTAGAVRLREPKPAKRP